jgi:hypothetical protein
MTLDQINAKIAELEAAKTRILTGQNRKSVRYDRGGAEFSEVKLSDINAELMKLRIMKSKLDGSDSGVGPFGFTFGPRP